MNKEPDEQVARTLHFQVKVAFQLARFVGGDASVECRVRGLGSVNLQLSLVVDQLQTFSLHHRLSVQQPLHLTKAQRVTNIT